MERPSTSPKLIPDAYRDVLSSLSAMCRSDESIHATIDLNLNAGETTHALRLAIRTDRQSDYLHVINTYFILKRNGDRWVAGSRTHDTREANTTQRRFPIEIRFLG